jgi:hypothetical protein
MPPRRFLKLGGSLSQGRSGFAEAIPPLVPTNPTQSETTALLAAMTVQPNAARANLINNLIFTLKNAGVWTTFDMLFIYAAHDAQAARINWVTPAQILTANGTLTFTVDRGYQGDGVTGFLSTGINWSALVKFTQNNAAFGVWMRTSNSVNAQAIGSTTTQRDTLNPFSGSNNLAIRINSAAAAVTATVPDGIGYSAGSRSISTNIDLYKNAVLLGSPAQNSTTMLVEEVLFLKSGANFLQSQMSAAHIGAGLNATQITAIYNALQTYMTGVGA